MRGLFTGLFVSVALTSGVFGVPSGYKLINKQSSGLTTYISNNNNIAVVEAVTGKSIIDFGVGEEGDINRYGHRTFKRQSIKNHYDLHDNGKLYMALNGQFFGWSTYTPLSFNVKNNGDLLQDKILEPEKGKRLFGVIRNKLPFIYKGSVNKENIRQSDRNKVQKTILSLLKSDTVSDGITGLDPFDYVIRGTSRIGRNMIGCIPYSKYDLGNIGICKKVYFFIGKKIKHNDLISEMKAWGIKDSYIITLDGSGSSQAYTREFQYQNKNFTMPGDGRVFPNSILIYSK